MKKLIIIALTAVVVLSGSAVAQAGDQPIDVSELNEDEEACITIDAETSVCAAELVDGTTAEILIESSTNQRVTVTDAVGLMTVGPVERETYTITEGENRIEFPVTVRRGAAGVSVDTGEVLFGLPIEKQTSLLDRPVAASDVQAGALGGASSVAVAILVMVVRAARGTDAEPEWVA